MIYGISGKTGGGKSYEAVVNHVIPMITQQKRKVVTNLPLQVDHFAAVFGEYVRDLIEVVDGDFHNYSGERPFSKTEHYLQYENWQNEQGLRVCFVIDECHLALAKGSTDKAVKEFYSMHRHYGFDIILITQNFRKVDNDIKDLISNHYRAIKKSFMGQDDKYILKVHDGASNTNTSVVATHEREYEQKYFKFYKSHTKSDSAIKEANANDIKKWYDNGFFKLSAVFFIVAFFILLNAFSDDAKEPKAAAAPTGQVQTVQVQTGQVQTGQVQTGQVQTTQVLTVPAQPKTKKPAHPFYKVQLHVAGYAEYMELGRLKKTYHIAASQNGQYMFELDLKDLALAGYTTKVRGICLIEVSYEDYFDYITCDSPRINLAPEVPVQDLAASADSVTNSST